MVAVAEREPWGIPGHKATLIHDVFNIVCISTLDLLYLSNIRYEAAVWTTLRLTDGPESWTTRWSGEHQGILLAAVFCYMTADVIFVSVLPQCVKIPRAILLHHLFCYLAMAVPWNLAATHGYTLGIFMTADFNTLFMLIRKMLLRRKLESTSLLPRVALLATSVGFYFTWVLVRLILYPTWLFTVSFPEWLWAWQRTGSPLNLLAVMPCANGSIVILSFKWTWDLCNGSRRKRDRATAEATGNLAELLRRPSSAHEHES